MRPALLSKNVRYNDFYWKVRIFAVLAKKVVYKAIVRDLYKYTKGIEIVRDLYKDTKGIEWYFRRVTLVYTKNRIHLKLFHSKVLPLNFFTLSFFIWTYYIGCYLIRSNSFEVISFKVISFEVILTKLFLSKLFSLSNRESSSTFCCEEQQQSKKLLFHPKLWSWFTKVFFVRCCLIYFFCTHAYTSSVLFLWHWHTHLFKHKKCRSRVINEMKLEYLKNIKKIFHVL